MRTPSHSPAPSLHDSQANKQARSVSRDAMSEDDLPEIGTELLIVEAEDFMEDLAYDLGMGTRHILTLLPGQVLEAYAMITRKWGGPAVEAPNVSAFPPPG